LSASNEAKQAGLYQRMGFHFSNDMRMRLDEDAPAPAPENTGSNGSRSRSQCY
jgi:hypothetical protein